MAKRTVTVSDISGELILNDTDVARIRITYDDARRNDRVIEASVAEVERLLGRHGKEAKPRGTRAHKAKAERALEPEPEPEPEPKNVDEALELERRKLERARSA